MGHFSLRQLIVILCLLCCSLGAQPASARQLHGYTIPEEVLLLKAKEKVKKELAGHILLKKKDNYIVAIEQPHYFNNRAFDFFLIIGLIAFLGVFRAANPAYFRNLFRAFRNPTLSTRQLKEQLRQDSAASLTMDIIFCISIGIYVYFVMNHLYDRNILPDYPVGIIMLGFILLFIVVYIFRFLFLKFTGWVFNITEITDNYTFNVFLINKILGIAIIPFTIILAFGEGAWVQVSLFLSFVVIAILFLNRYLRSGVVFGYFIKFSKFHFFMYLCASELLPLAVLMKIVNKWLIS